MRRPSQHEVFGMSNEQGLSTLLTTEPSLVPRLLQTLAAEKAFAALPSKIDTIKGFEWGTNVSPENLAQGFMPAEELLDGLLIFLAIDAHHWFFRALVESFTLIPPFQFVMSSSFIGYLMNLAGNMFIIALKIGAPVIVVLILTSVSFGLMARTVPQMNIFIVAMPLKIVVGLLFVVFSLPYLQTYLRELFDGFGSGLVPLFRLMGS